MNKFKLVQLIVERQYAKLAWRLARYILAAALGAVTSYISAGSF